MNKNKLNFLTKYFQPILLIFLIASGSAIAENRAWSVGVASAVQDMGYKEASPKKYVFPYFRYTGDKLTIDLTSISYELLSESNFDLSATGQFRFDGFKSSDSDFLFGLEDRDSSFDAGLSFNYKSEFGNLSGKIITDITNTHSGSELQVTISKPYILKEFAFTPYATFIHQDNKLINYYYGINEYESTISRPKYVGEASNSLSFGLNLIWQTSKKHKLISGLDYRILDDQILDSPIVDSHNQMQLYLGWLYDL